MFRKFLLVFTVLASVGWAVAQTDAQRKPGQRAFLPSYVVYRTLFHALNTLDQKAAEAEGQGRFETAQTYRRALRQDFDLSDESTATLNRIAAEYEKAVQKVDARAREILRARRQYYPDNTLPVGRAPLGASPELATLQQERNSLALQYAGRLQEAMNPSDWERFDDLVMVRIAAGIKSSSAVQPVKFVKTKATAQTNAQAVITGSTLVSYNAFANTVTSISTTELDFAAQDFYTGRVIGTLSDANGNGTNASAGDTDGDGIASVTLQLPGQDQMTYLARGTYGARVEIQDVAQGVRYLDGWNFQNVYAGGEGGYSYWLYMPFYGPGPLRYTNLRNLSLGSTSPATIQAKPRVESQTPTFSDDDIMVDSPLSTTNESTVVMTQVQASSKGLQTGDRVEVEIITRTGNNGAITWTNGRQVETVNLVLGGSTTVSFPISGISQAGTYTFTTRITDVQRPNGQGGYMSIYSSVTTNDPGMTSGNLTVRN